MPRRWTMVLRVTYQTLLLTALAWLTWRTGRPWALYYLVLWLVPLETTFALYMVLRELAFHGNTGRERLTSARVILSDGLTRLALFPLSVGYHLPHHLFPLVPHYRLRQLHALLQETDEYRRDAAVAEGYLWPAARPARACVLELMAEERAAFIAG